MTEQCHREHKVGDMHTGIRTASLFEIERNRLAPLSFWRASRLVLNESMRAEAERCRFRYKLVRLEMRRHPTRLPLAEHPFKGQPYLRMSWRITEVHP